MRRHRVAASVITLAILAAGCLPQAAPWDGDVSDFDSHGCGHRFVLGSPDQGVAIVFEFVSATPPREIVLPSEAVEGAVLIGEDLLANSCDDTVDAGAPTPQVDERWPITEGELVIERLPDDECGRAAGVADDVVALMPDNQAIEIDRLELVNDSWGCFPE